jgi:hypothetical protein
MSLGKLTPVEADASNHGRRNLVRALAGAGRLTKAGSPESGRPLLNAPLALSVRGVVVA